MRALLLHPPLLSPVVWRRLAPLLAQAGHPPSAPRLALTPTRRWWEAAAQSAAAAAPDAELLLAHSGAGVLVPEVAGRLPGLQAVVLLDAVLPARAGETVPSPDLRRLVAELADDGVLPPWPHWWPEHELAEQLPDPADRAALEAEAPWLPSAFYDVPVPVPAGWEPPVVGYLQLSPAYREQRQEAERRGWRTAVLDGRHLDLLARPQPVVDAVQALLGAG